MALNTDYALRTGAFDPTKGKTIEGLDLEELKKQALQRYEEAKVPKSLQYDFHNKYSTSCELVQKVLFPLPMRDKLMRRE